MIQNRKIKTIIAKLLGVDKTMQIVQCVPLVVDISFPSFPNEEASWEM